MSVWEEISDHSFVRFTDGVVVVRFENNEPAEIVNKFGATQWNFTVDGDLIFGVTSKNLMRLLKNHRPLKGKTLKISRTGRGFDTKYAVEAVTAP